MRAGSESALSPLGAADKLNALSRRLQKDARHFQERVSAAGKAPGAAAPRGHGSASPEFSFWADAEGGRAAAGADAGRLRRGLETSLAATAALMEACEGARGAMDAIQRDSQGLVAGIEAQVSLTHRELTDKWQQHEAEVAGIAEDVAVTLEAAMATIAARDVRIRELEGELRRERDALRSVRGERAEEQARELECVRTAMRVSEEREAEARRLREEVSSLHAELERARMGAGAADARLRSELDDTRGRLDRVSGAASRMVISELRERSLSASIQQQQQQQRRDSADGPGAPAERRASEEEESSGVARPGADGPGERADPGPGSPADGGAGGGSGTSDLLAKLEESKAKRAAAVSKARSINRRRSVSLSQLETRMRRRETVA